jgi:hypothetical protein
VLSAPGRGRSHGINRCDNSFLPSSLAANPALTIVALSLLAVETFLREVYLSGCIR